MAEHEQQDRRRPSYGALFSGMLVLALVIGGLAGAAGGYLVAQRRPTVVAGPAPNALDTPPPAQNTSAPPAGSVEAAAASLLPTVVRLQHTSGQNQISGSGVVFSSDGLILTNDHVVADSAAPIQVSWQDGTNTTATVVGQDPTSDLAVIKAVDMHGLPAARFGRSDDLRVGQQVVAIGAPFRLSGTVTTGIVSALHRPTRAGGDDGDQTTVVDAVQTDAAINPGNSGGPLVNLSGQVIGINSSIYPPPNTGQGTQQQASNMGIGFAIPVDQAKRIGAELASTGKATQPVLGASVRDDTSTGGARISSVTPGGPGDRSGLHAGDVVTKFNQRPVEGADGLVTAIHAAAPGSTVTLTLQDGRALPVALGGQQVGSR